LNPKPPFHPNAHRLRLASALAPLAAVSPFVTRDLAFQGASFLFGALFFGKPVLNSAFDWMHQRYPSWSEKMDLNKYVEVPS
jgi:hypothetical protein